MKNCLITTLGARTEADLGIILAHEHVFVDLRTPDSPGYAEAELEDVIRQISPEIRRAQEAGVSAIVECSTVGVGRRADILVGVSQATGMPLVVPTGIYREPWVPAWAHDSSEEQLFNWMRVELTARTIDFDVPAGFIKLSAGDDGMTSCERKILRAAARASAATGAAIGSHTIRGVVVADQLETIESCGGDPRRFIWIHASAEPDFTLNLEMARRGAWIEYDWIHDPATDESLIERLLRMLEAGYGDQVLLSQDRGWYDPALAGGGIPQPYTYLFDEFLPKLKAYGVDDGLVERLLRHNPFQAFSRPLEKV